MEKKNQKTVDLLAEWRDKPPVDQSKVLAVIREQARSALAAKAAAHQRSQEIEADKARVAAEKEL